MTSLSLSLVGNLRISNNKLLSYDGRKFFKPDFPFPRSPGSRRRRSHNLNCALPGDIRPNPPRTFSFFHSDN